MRQDRIEFVKACRRYLGTPFKHRGRTRNGLDCAGLIVVALQDLGQKPYDLKVYGREPHKDGLRQTVVRNLGEPLKSGVEWLPGDVVLMRFVREPHHLGVFGDYPGGGLSLIHSFGEVGKVVEHRLDEKWKERVLEVYRFED